MCTANNDKHKHVYNVPEDSLFKYASDAKQNL